jgi:WD40 repeat protein
MRSKFQEKSFHLSFGIGMKKDAKTNQVLWYANKNDKTKRNLITGSRDYDLRLWHGNQCVKVLDGHKSDITCIRLYDNNQEVISSSSDGKIKVFSLNPNYDCVKTLHGHVAAIYSFLLYENDKLISCSDDRTIKIWCLNKGICLKTLEGHTDYVLNVLVLEETQHLASCSNDATIKIWSLNGDMNLERTLVGHKMGVRNALLNTDKPTQIISCSWDGSVKIWNYLNGTCKMTLKGHTRVVRNILISNRKNLISYSFDQTIRVWDTKIGECLFILNGHTDFINSCLLLSQCELISCDDKNVKIWDLLNGRCLKTIKTGANCLLLNEFIGCLLIGNKRGEIQYLNLSNGASIQTLKGHSSSVDRLLWYS